RAIAQSAQAPGSGPRAPEGEPSSPASANRISTPLPSGEPATCDYRRYQAGPLEFRVDSNLVRLIRFNNRDFGEQGGELFGIHVENFRMTDRTGKTVAVADLLAEGRVEGQDERPSKVASISLEDPCWRAATSEQGNPAE